MRSSDPALFLKLQKKIFVVFGVWPEWKLTHPYAFVASVVSYLLSFALFLSLSVRLLILIRLGDIEGVANNMFYYMTHTSYMIKFSIFLFKRKQMLMLINKIRSPIFLTNSSEDDKIVEKWLKISNFFSYSFLVACNCCVGFFSISPFIDKDENNILPVGGWYPIDVVDSIKNRAAVFAVQVFALIIAVQINACIDTLSTGCMNFGCCQIQILKRKMKTIFKSIESNDANKKDVWLLSEASDGVVLKATIDFVRHHGAIMEYVRLVENIFTFGMLAQFVASGIVLCTAAFELIVIPPGFQFFSIIFYMQAIFVQLGAYCWNGQQVIVESSSIGDSCYKVEWYRCSRTVKKCILMIIMRCRRPMSLTAGYYFPLSIETLMKIVRSAYSFFALLQTMYSEKK